MNSECSSRCNCTRSGDFVRVVTMKAVTTPRVVHIDSVYRGLSMHVYSFISDDEKLWNENRFQHRVIIRQNAQHTMLVNVHSHKGIGDAATAA